MWTPTLVPNDTPIEVSILSTSELRTIPHYGWPLYPKLQCMHLITSVKKKLSTGTFRLVVHDILNTILHIRNTEHQIFDGCLSANVHECMYTRKADNEPEQSLSCADSYICVIYVTLMPRYELCHSHIHPSVINETLVNTVFRRSLTVAFPRPLIADS